MFYQPCPSPRSNRGTLNVLCTFKVPLFENFSPSFLTRILLANRFRCSFTHPPAPALKGGGVLLCSFGRFTPAKTTKKYGLGMAKMIHQQYPNQGVIG